MSEELETLEGVDGDAGGDPVQVVPTEPVQSEDTPEESATPPVDEPVDEFDEDGTDGELDDFAVGVTTVEQLEIAVGDGLDFSEEIFACEELAGTHLEGGLFERCDFSAADLSDVNAKNASWQRSVFVAASLNQSQLSGGDFGRCNLSAVGAEQADFADINGLEACFDGSYITHANFRRAKLDFASFAGVDARFSNFESATLSEVSFAGADLRGASLDGALGESMVCAGADLREMSAVGASLQHADFSGSSARRASFIGADLRGADFSGSDVSQADFTGADIRGAEFSGAALEGADFTGAAIDGAQWWGTDVELSPSLEALLTARKKKKKKKKRRRQPAARSMVMSDGIPSLQLKILNVLERSESSRATLPTRQLVEDDLTTHITATTSQRATMALALLVLRECQRHGASRLEPGTSDEALQALWPHLSPQERVEIEVEAYDMLEFIGAALSPQLSAKANEPPQSVTPESSYEEIARWAIYYAKDLRLELYDRQAGALISHVLTPTSLEAGHYLRALSHTTKEEHVFSLKHTGSLEPVQGWTMHHHNGARAPMPASPEAPTTRTKSQMSWLDELPAPQEEE